MATTPRKPYAKRAAPPDYDKGWLDAELGNVQRAIGGDVSGLEVGVSNPAYEAGDVRRYGASVDRIDNAPAINNALLSAKAIGLARVSVRERYPTRTAIVLQSNVELAGEGDAQIVQTGAADAIHAVGTDPGISSLLTANAVVDQYTATVANGSLFADGDFVFISESVTGEQGVNKVVGTPVANVLQFLYPNPRTFTVANGGYVSKILPVVRPKVSGLKVQVTTGYMGVRFTLCDAPSVERMPFVVAGRHGVAAELCTEAYVERVYLEGSGTVGPDGPGISFRGVQRGTIAFCTNARQQRDEPYTLFKNCTDILIVGCTGNDAVGAGFQADHENRRVTFLACSMDRNGNVAFYAINNNEDVQFIGCRSTRAGTYPFAIEDGCNNVRVRDCVGANGALHGLRIKANCTNVRYSDNEFVANGSGDISDAQPALTNPLSASNSLLLANGLAIFDPAGVAVGAGAAAGYLSLVLNGVAYKVQLLAP